MSGTGSKKKLTPAQRRAKAAEVRAAAARAERRERLVRGGIYGGIAIVAIGAVVGTALYVSHRDSAKGGLPHPAAAAGTSMPPWAAPADPSAGIQQAGLRANSMEGTAAHYHAHLDILVNGKATPVPANLGINTSSGQMAELHTHDATGVLHIEAPDAKRRYTVGQLFVEWGVRLDATQIGGLKATGGKTLRAYVNGKKVAGNPANIELTAHREIALIYGTPSQKVKVPSNYNFPSGE